MQVLKIELLDYILIVDMADGLIVSWAISGPDQLTVERVDAAICGLLSNSEGVAVLTDLISASLDEKRRECKATLIALLQIPPASRS